MNLLNSTITKTVKLAFLFLLVMATGVSTMAQKNINFGLKAAPGIFWLKSSDDTTKGDGSKFGFGYGAMLEFGLTDNYYLVTGVDLVTIGAKTKYEATFGTYKVSSTSQSTIQYLQIPLFLKMKTKEIGMMKYFGQFGLGTGFALSSKNKYESTTTTTTTTGTVVTTSNSSDTKKDEIFFLREALLIGAGFEYNISGSTSLVVGVTYDNGFTPVLRNKNASGKENPSLRSKGVILTVGILF